MSEHNGSGNCPRCAGTGIATDWLSIPEARRFFKEIGYEIPDDCEIAPMSVTSICDCLAGQRLAKRIWNDKL